MNGDKKNKFKDRRKGPDFWCKWVRVFGILNWIIVSIILFIADEALPEKSTFIDRVFKLPVDTTMDSQKIKIAVYLVIFLFLGTGISLLANLKRLRRKDDKINKSNLIIFLLSGICTVVFTFYFF